MFPPEVKVKAMLACTRRCCLCRKIAGTKMECHHIIPREKGGPDTFDNCIPLCLECHAEVGHYNDKHPKGTKFSSAELQGHRDRWYSICRDGKGSEAPADFVELDQKLFNRLYEMLGGSKKMVHFRDHDYGNGYSVKVEHRINDFSHETSLPQAEFYDEQMASALADLRAAIRAYDADCINRIWHDGDWAHIPPEWNNSEKGMKRFDDAREVMNQSAAKVWEAFTQFVKTARLRLKVDIA